MSPEIARSITVLPSVSIDETRSGAPGIVDLWWFAYENSLDPRTASRYERWMTDEERARHQRFHFARDRDLFLATRALVRATLSRYADVAPEDWRFTAGEYGRPAIADADIASRLHFNLANTPGMVACVVSVAHAAVGVDVEATDRTRSALDIADRFFSRDEVDALRALPAERHAERFLELWTLKESYIKARGMGLSLPLDAFSLALDGDRIGIRFDDRIADDGDRWQFRLLTDPRHVIAVAADTGGAPLRLRGAPVQLAAAYR